MLELISSTTWGAILAKATLLLAASLLIGLMARSRSAASRHLLRTGTLAALLLLPLASISMPQWQVKYQAATQPLIAAPKVLETMQAPLHSAQTSPVQSRASESANAALNTETHTFSATTATSAEALPAVPARAISWRTLMIIAWGMGAGLFLLRFVASLFHVSQLSRRAAAVEDPEWLQLARASANRLRIRRPVSLLASSEIDVPITIGVVYPKVLLPAGHEQWSVVRRNAVLDHELAHIKRHDALTQLIGQLTSAMYWFHPLVWMTVRAMKNERERACDDHVIAAGIKASDYAHELLEIVSVASGRNDFAAALSMARKSQFEGRILALLDARLRRGTISRSSTLAAAVVCAAIVLPLAAVHPVKASTRISWQTAETATAPTESRQSSSSAQAAPAVAVTSPRSGAIAAVVQESPASPPSPASPQEPKRQPTSMSVVDTGAGAISGCALNEKHSQINITSHSDDGGRKRFNATWSNRDCSLDMRSEGEVTFNAEATEITSISQGGYFDASERVGENLRHVRITPGNGQLVYEFAMNGAKQQATSENRAWLGNFLLMLERATGFGAEKRVPLLISKGGPNAVLQEVAQLQSDYVRSLYLRLLLDKTQLNVADLRRVIDQGRQSIGSDYELARLLMLVAQKYELADETTRSTFLQAANKLGSDYEHARVLIELLKRPNLSKDSVRMALESAARIGSDYEKARVLITLAEMKIFDEQMQTVYYNAANKIGSDYEHARTLIALLDSGKLSDDQVGKLIESATRIGSDYEKARVLTSAAAKYKMTGGLRDEYLKAANSIGSEYERKRALSAIGNKEAKL